MRLVLSMCDELTDDKETSEWPTLHYSDVIMSAMASQLTSLKIVCLTVYLRRRSKKTSKLHVTGLCAGNSPVTGEFPAQIASNTEKVSIWWRYYAQKLFACLSYLGVWAEFPTHQGHVRVSHSVTDVLMLIFSTRNLQPPDVKVVCPSVYIIIVRA